MTMLAAFIGRWELLLIAAVLGVMISVPLIIIAVVIFFVRRQRSNNAPSDNGAGQ